MAMSHDPQTIHKHSEAPPQQNWSTKTKIFISIVVIAVLGFCTYRIAYPRYMVKRLSDFDGTGKPNWYEKDILSLPTRDEVIVHYMNSLKNWGWIDLYRSRTKVTTPWARWDEWMVGQYTPPWDADGGYFYCSIRVGVQPDGVDEVMEIVTEVTIEGQPMD